MFESASLVDDLLGRHARASVDVARVAELLAGALGPELALEVFVACERCAAPIPVRELAVSCGRCGHVA